MDALNIPASTESATFAPARFVDAPAMTLVGFREPYTFDTMQDIPAQWGRFEPRIDTIPAKVGQITYGVVLSTADRSGFDYMSAVEISNATRLPADFVTLEISTQRYAVFPHPGHVSTLCETIDAIFRQWLPASGQELTGLPDFLERYGEEFDPETATGDIEVWVPVMG